MAAGLFFLYLGTLGGGESVPGSTPPASTPLPPQESSPKEAVPGPRRLGEVGVALAGLSALVILGFLSLLAFLVWRHRERGGQETDRSFEPQVPRSFKETYPQDRVRRAYYQALKALKKSGLPRLASEGPLEYLKRASTLLPGLREPLWELTRLYLPRALRGKNRGGRSG